MAELKLNMLKSFFWHFQFQLLHQGVVLNFDLIFLIYGPFVKKATFIFLIAYKSVLINLAPYIASILKSRVELFQYILEHSRESYYFTIPPRGSAFMLACNNKHAIEEGNRFIQYSMTA